MELWHGSEVVVERPLLDKCRQFNDYGRGFYCTPHEEMAMEWACRTESDGVANRYELDLDGFGVWGVFNPQLACNSGEQQRVQCFDASSTRGASLST